MRKNQQLSITPERGRVDHSSYYSMSTKSQVLHSQRQFNCEDKAKCIQLKMKLMKHGDMIAFYKKQIGRREERHAKAKQQKLYAMEAQRKRILQLIHEQKLRNEALLDLKQKAESERFSMFSDNSILLMQSSYHSGANNQQFLKYLDR